MRTDCDLPLRPKVSGWRIILGLVVVTGLVAAVQTLRKLKNDNAALNAKIVRSLDPVRIDIKLALDEKAPSPTEPAKLTTVSEILALERPSQLGLDERELHDDRYGELETTIWKLNVVVDEIIVREDNDYYLVLQDGGMKTVAELPDPELCKASPFYLQIKAIREQLQRELKPTKMPQTIGRRAEITGIGFFGKPSRGLRKNNGARIYPLLSLRWIQ